MSVEQGEQAEPAFTILKGVQVDKARAAIQAAPADATAAHFDQIIRKTAMVTVPVRKALVEEEVNRRANLQEDQAQTAMDGQPAAPGQSRTELQAWADGVKNGEHPFLHVPAKSDFVPVGVDGLTRTRLNGAGAFSGTYYHAPEVSAADIRKAARDKKDPQGALDAIVANWKGCGNYDQMSDDDLRAEEVVVSNWKGEEMPVELASHSRSILRQRAPQLVTVLVIVAGIAAWFYHSHEIDRRASEATEAEAAARESQANSIAARVKNSWNADDTWEDTFSSKGAAYTPYTIELENALIKGRPILAFGSVDDVRKSEQQDNSIVLIEDFGRTTGVDLRFSLLSAPAITKAILNDQDRAVQYVVIAATITSVEKVSMPPDKSDNDRDYFLAHGILNEAQPIGLLDMRPFKDLLSRVVRSGDE
jgi:hypothetical protein